MGIDDQIRLIENRLTALEKDRSILLNELKGLRAQRDEQKPVMLLCLPALMKASDSNEEKFRQNPGRGSRFHVSA